MAAVRYERSGAIARITRDRPSVLDAADKAWVADLEACADRAAADRGARVVVALHGYCIGGGLQVALAAERSARSGRA